MSKTEQHINMMQALKQIPSALLSGRVQSVCGSAISVTMATREVGVGDYCEIETIDNTKIPAEVISFDRNAIQLMAMGSMKGIGPDCRVIFSRSRPEINPTMSWCGRIINGLGQPLDGFGPLALGPEPVEISANPPLAAQRNRVGGKINVGVRAINTFLTCCHGQRLGIFAGSGVGKSYLLSMLARFTESDICVIGLIGERGREMKEFIENTLGEEGLRKSVVIVATSDEPPLLRRQAAYTTMAVAEYFRSQGKSVLCLMDSVTRFAMAQREVGLAAGEPPTTKGYTPSVFSELARLLERAGPGTGNDGNMTAFFSVLVDGDDHNEPIADAVRGILDGHFVLDRAIAERGHFPAINILKSVSRMIPNCLEDSEWETLKKARQLLATYEDMAEMIRLGAYQPGSNPEVDYAIRIYPALSEFLAQDYRECTDISTSFAMLRGVIGETA